jgi:hypothetical protein
MRSPPPKVIRKEACLRPKSLFKLSKDFGPNRHLNTWKEESKGKNDCMNVEDGSVHPKRYNGHCTKQ